VNELLREMTTWAALYGWKIGFAWMVLHAEGEALVDFPPLTGVPH
jgi:hypothetical protein